MRHVLNLVDKANGAVFAQLAMQQQPAAAGNAPPVAPEFVYGSASLAADDTDLWTRYQEKYVDGLEVAERDPAPGSLPGGALSAAAAAAAAGSGHSAAAAAGASSGGPKALHRGAAAAAARPHQEHSTPQRTDEEEEELPPLV